MPSNKIIVVVPPRPQYGNAAYGIGRRFDSGATILEVDDAQLAELQEESKAGIFTVMTEDDYLAASEKAKTEGTPPPPPPVEDVVKPGKPMRKG